MKGFFKGDFLYFKVLYSTLIKGTEACDGFFAHCILSGIERGSYIFSCCVIFTELGQDLTHLAHKENTQSEIFLLLLFGQKILIAFCSLRANMVEILTLLSPRMWLKNLGALFKYAKCRQRLTKIQKI